MLLFEEIFREKISAFFKWPLRIRCALLVRIWSSLIRVTGNQMHTFSLRAVYTSNRWIRQTKMRSRIVRVQFFFSSVGYSRLGVCCNEATFSSCLLFQTFHVAVLDWGKRSPRHGGIAYWCIMAAVPRYKLAYECCSTKIVKITWIATLCRFKN